MAALLAYDALSMSDQPNDSLQSEHAIAVLHGD